MCIQLKKDGVTICALEEKRIEACEYTLYSISIGGIERFILSAKTDADTDIQMVGGNKAQAEELFRLICHNQISCCHLEEVADDYRKQIKYGAVQI